MAKIPSRKKAKEASEQHAVSAVFMADNVDSMSKGLVDPSTITYSEKLVSAIRDRPIYSVSHKNDMDGVSSSALLHKFYSVPTERIKFMEYSDASYNEVAQWLTGKGISNSVVVFTDIGINPGAFKLFQSTLLTLKQKGNMVVWLDHHPWEPEQVNFCAENVSYLVAGENRLMCGADLTYNVLCRKLDSDGKGERLTALAHLMDFNIRSKSTDPLTFRLAEAITYMLWAGKDAENLLRRMVPMVAELDFGNRFIVNNARKYLEEEKVNLEELLSSAKTFSVGKHSITIGFGKRLQSTAACEALMSKSGSDISVFVNYLEERCSLRSKSGVDCSYIAKAMGGNGHPQAGGFASPSSEYTGFNEKGRAKLVKRIVEVATA